MSSPDAAPNTAAAMSQAHATFEAMLEILHGQWPQAGLLTTPYLMAATAAADGRDALATASAASSQAPGPWSQLPVPGPGASADAIADALATVAGTLAERLAGAAAAASEPRDRDAPGW